MGGSNALLKEKQKIPADKSTKQKNLTNTLGAFCLIFRRLNQGALAGCGTIQVLNKFLVLLEVFLYKKCHLLFYCLNYKRRERILLPRNFVQMKNRIFRLNSVLDIQLQHCDVSRVDTRPCGVPELLKLDN